MAFVGPNGSGKTTLAKILAFLYEPSEGQVLWNDVDAAEMDREALRDRVTTVFQDHMTYHFSVADNVALDLDREADPEAVRDALNGSGASPTVDRLPLGIETQLGQEFEGGTSLSGGELQRLGMARSIFRSRELVIMDEPTSALDAQADYALLNELRRLLLGRTGIVISHRFSNVRNADQIFVFNEGRIVERGSHGQLMAAQGLYAEMYSLQAAAFVEQPMAWGGRVAVHAGAPPLGLIEYLDLSSSRDTAARQRMAFDGALAAETLGYTRIWAPEHHGLGSPSPNPLPVVSVIGSRTERIRVGTAVILLRIRDPLLTAEDIATAASFCGGRPDIGLGRGSHMGAGWESLRHLSKGDDELDVDLRHLLAGFEPVSPSERVASPAARHRAS